MRLIQAMTCDFKPAFWLLDDFPEKTVIIRLLGCRLISAQPQSQRGEPRRGVPDRSAQNMPFSTRRSSTRGTPRGLLGKSGSITCHSKSVRSYRLMQSLESDSAAIGKPPVDLVADVFDQFTGGHFGSAAATKSSPRNCSASGFQPPAPSSMARELESSR